MLGTELILLNVSYFIYFFLHRYVLCITYPSREHAGVAAIINLVSSEVCVSYI